MCSCGINGQNWGKMMIALNDLLIVGRVFGVCMRFVSNAGMFMLFFDGR